jgi:acyl-CoA thioester hydrolase
MLDLPTDIDLTDKATFCFWTLVTLRYSDQDAMAHINNCAYAAFIEAGRTMFLGGLLDPNQHPKIDCILARIAIDYRREMHYPGMVEVGSRILRLGTKSMTTGFGLFKNDECVCTAESVNLFFDISTRTSIPIPADIHRTLEADPMQTGRANS